MAEYEDRIPAVRMLMSVSINHLNGKITYSADDFWLDCHELDEYIIGLEKSDQPVHELKNMNGNISIKISATEHDVFTFSFVSQEGPYPTSSCVTYSTIIDLQIFRQLRDKFNEMERFW